MLAERRVLIVISGGISAYKIPVLIRNIRKKHVKVTCVLTKGGSKFVTPLTLSSVSETKAYSDLWSLTDEAEMGHIRLSREHDLIVVAPASADFIAKMSHGIANDLASTLLLAANKPVLLAPAMNPIMWEHEATQKNVETLRKRGVQFIGPCEGDTACGETGMGRMSEPEEICLAIENFFLEKPLKGLKALVTAGPTYEAIDPVRFIGNRSSGKQGYAITEALLNSGAEVTLVSGPTKLKPVYGANTVHVRSAQEMLVACKKSLPVDICVCSAAVSDWRATNVQKKKIKKEPNTPSPSLSLTKNPDILKYLSNCGKERPSLVIGFAAETENIKHNAKSKLMRKRCDWILANLVGKDKNGNEKAFGSDENQIYFLSRNQESLDVWENMPKKRVAERLVSKIIEHFNNQET